MNQKERYLEEVRSHLLATDQERERFTRDLETHFEEGEARGESTARIIERLGSPETVAAAFNAEMELEKGKRGPRLRFSGFLWEHPRLVYSW